MIWDKTQNNPLLTLDGHEHVVGNYIFVINSIYKECVMYVNCEKANQFI